MIYSRSALDSLVDVVVWQLLNSISRDQLKEKLGQIPTVDGVPLSEDDISYIYVVLRDRAMKVPEGLGGVPC